jgi:hypothetical protein
VSDLQPKLGRIVWSDFFSLLLVVGPIASWAIYVATAFGLVFHSRYSGSEVTGRDPAVLFVALGITLVCVPLLVLRIRRVKMLFANGRVVPAEITAVNFVRDRGRVDYRFSLDGMERTGWSALHKNARTTSLSVGQRVDLVVDPANPKHSLIADFYI